MAKPATDGISGFLVRASASFGFAGYLPIAPGSWGSLAAVIPAYLFFPADWRLQLAIVAVTGGIAVGIAGCAERYFGHDGSRIVIDEVAGMGIALLGVPRSVLWYGLAFLLFRLFDIVKPFPARHCEKLPGGFGVVTDDIVAGLYALGVVRILLLTWN